MVSIDSILNARPAILALRNGMVFHGTGFGVTKRVFGECVFTANEGAGYDEILTDPNTWGQINIFTYPLIGNVGLVNWERDALGITKLFESESIKTSGIVVHELCRNPSHYEMKRTLEDFMREGGIPGIEGIDTRQLVQILRNEGLQLAMLEVYENAKQVPTDDELCALIKKTEDTRGRNLMPEISRKKPEIFTPSNPKATVVAIDCGIKNSLIRNLINRGFKTVVVPYNTPYDAIMAYNPNGVLISNGPGNPKNCIEVIATVKKLLAANMPIMGICLGNLILALAAGAETYKMKFGHHGSSRSVIDATTGRGYVTGQYHSYAVDIESLKSTGFKMKYQNLDDKTCEGIYHPQKPCFGIQFPPGPFPAPEDTNFLYDEFVKNMGLKN